jgi:U32 family peptidase
MKVLAPFSLPQEVPLLIDAGASELYCGIVPEELSAEWGEFESLNRRRGYDANLWNFKDLRRSIEVAHERDVPVFVTLNRFYSESQHPYVVGLAEHLRQTGVDGLIVIDIGLLLSLADTGLRFPHTIVGTGGSTLNSEAISFYRELGATRVVLSRHLSLEEIVSLANATVGQIELEAFILNSLCPFEDGFCTFYHGHEPPRYDRLGPPVSYDPYFEGCGCRIEFAYRAHGILGGDPIAVGFAHDRLDRLREAGVDCGACGIFDFVQAGVHSLKIVERALPTRSKVRCTQFVRQAVELAQARNAGRDEFIKAARAAYTQLTGSKCTGYECYYPSATCAPHS